ncbi:ABC transporter substrate-binding protein [Leptolyngbya sp. AN02str]|uniref:ABC transporter substrate-binding protein n=1 Tax=Leptolyngbya sp. AN02str TaxID=3423363 RepID=UPI003D31100C
MIIHIRYLRQLLQGRRHSWWRSLATLATLSFTMVLIASCTGMIPQSIRNNPPSTMSPSSAVRPIDHAMGTTQVPKIPERVVVIDSAALDAVLALGVKPIGSTIYGDPIDGAWPAYLGQQTQDIEIVGEVNQPNLESILKLQPDLILGTKVSAERLYRPLSRIAPTVLTEGSGRSGDWKENFLLFAAALDKTDRANQLIEDYQQRVSELRAQFTQAKNMSVTDMQISVLTTGQGRIGFYTLNSFPGSVLQDIGFARPPAQTRPQRWAAMVSREELDSLDGDVIFLIHSAQASRSMTIEEFTRDPILSQMSAVQTGQIYQVNGESWVAGRSIQAAHQILDDITQSLLEPRAN